MSYLLPVNKTIVLSFIIFVFFILGVYRTLNSYPKNDCEMTFMFQYPQFVEISFPHDVRQSFPNYALYGYGEGSVTEQLRKMKFKGIPVLFIPGSSGSFKQGRSIASISLRKSLNSRTPFHFNYFMIDFNEEQTGIYGGVLEKQIKFVLHSIRKILALYKNNNEPMKPDSVILIGHSMGGLIAKGVLMSQDFDAKLIRLIVSLATPHKHPLAQFDQYTSSYYKNLKSFWEKNSDLEHISMVSIGGGPKDEIVRSDATFDPDSDINVLTTAVPGVWLTNDHLSILWCKQLVLTIVRALFDSVDIATKQLSTDKEHVKNVFQYHLLKRSDGKRFSASFTSRFASFERSTNWFENLQRQFTVEEAGGLKNNHYVMIRLFSDPKSEKALIEAFNVNVKDWVYVCFADVVYNSIRMCETGENISNLTEIAPVEGSLRLKRKFAYLDLHELKRKSFSHVIIRLPQSEYYMSVNVDVHQSSKRNISHQVPRYYSLSTHTVIEKTRENAIFYSVQLLGFERVWQSFILDLKVLSCKSEKNHAVVTFTTPWSKEDQNFILHKKKLLTIPLNIITPRPKNSTSYPSVRFHLDPTCTYQVTIQSSVIGMFSQGVRYYSLMLPAFLTTVLLLTLREQMKNLDEGKCALLHSALSSAVKRYFIVLQATVLVSQLLGSEIGLSLFPSTDFHTLQELNLDSFFPTIMLYGVAVIVVYILGVVVYLSIVVSGQAAHKMALRFVAKAVSGVFNLSEWVIAALHQLPFFVSALLISLAFSTTGAVALWLGTFFYFLKLCKMYEEYLENWFHNSIKKIASKVKDVITGTSGESLGGENEKEETTELVSKENEENENKEIETVNRGTELRAEDRSKDTERDLASGIHFHASTIMIWLLTALLYIPSLLVWAKNYQYNFSLEKDPALIPGVVFSACGAILWQPGVPKPCVKLSKVTSVSMFAFAVVSIVYASLSTYRLGFILSAGVVIITINQVLSKFM